MAIQISTYSAPKSGHQTSENQDASWPRYHPRHKARILKYKDKEIPKSGLNFTVSDGASEGLFSGIWARIIASRAAPKSRSSDDHDHGLDAEVLQQWVERSLEVWKRFMSKRMHTRTKSGTSLTRLPSWLEKPALEEGGFATLAALQIRPDGIWSAMAVGDSCIFRVRSKILQDKIPNMDPTDFENRPFLLGSVHGIDDETKTRVEYRAKPKKRNRWGRGDRFYIMSDAMACCFLKRCNLGREPWTDLNGLEAMGPALQFEELVARWRDNFGMRNDDVTLIRIDIM